jgi:hypothetical protein
MVLLIFIIVVVRVIVAITAIVAIVAIYLPLSSPFTTSVTPSVTTASTRVLCPKFRPQHNVSESFALSTPSTLRLST